jgi:protein involved in polysaccharide export with SLBB domain
MSKALSESQLSSGWHGQRYSVARGLWCGRPVCLRTNDEASLHRKKDHGQASTLAHATRRLRILAMLSLVTFLIGCTEARQSDPGASTTFKHSTLQDVSAKEYRVAPPDKLSIRAEGVKELEAVTTIRPDGKIQINLVGEFYVAGKTPEEIAQILTTAAAKYYNGATVQVEVAEFNSKFYTVFGTAVRSGGRKPYTGRDTVIAALASAGFNEDAWPQQIHISRPAGNGGHTTAIVDMKTMYTTGDTTQNYLLEEGDIIFVPDSPLTAFEKTARKVLTPFSAIAGTAQTVTPVSR